ncbi:MAG: SusE domain-containing protein [Prevotellaceae bacterium]|jgi:uncharacterized protein (TIGR02145 family)|nr:SusE domain-containing protein [Prevotellaceae bacterium]
MKNLANILCFVSLLLLCSCRSNDIIEVEVPLSGIMLASPSDGIGINLNDNNVLEYTFTWDEKSGTENYTLIFSLNEHLLNPVYISAGNATSKTFTAKQIDEYFAIFGIVGGATKTIYWSVKPSAALGIASNEIRSFAATRVKTRLLKPDDMSEIQLLWPETSTTLQFIWDTEGIDPETEFDIVLGNTAEMNGIVSTIPVGKVNTADITHEQLQAALTLFQVSRFSFSNVYWNIRNRTKSELISSISGVINLGDMMMFEDVRGDERIKYKVARITYSDGSSHIWLAENLRAKNYPDGTAIESANVKEASETSAITAGHVKAYGCYYTYWIQDRIAPQGFRLPTFREWEILFEDARIVGGSFAVIKDPVYYETFDGKNSPEANSWGLGLVSAGNFNGGSLSNAKREYCYYYASGLMSMPAPGPYHNFVHDGGWTLWPTWGTPSPARFIYTGE